MDSLQTQLETNNSRWIEQEVRDEFSNNECWGVFSNNERRGEFSNNERRGEFSNNERRGEFSNNERRREFSNNERWGEFGNNERRGLLVRLLSLQHPTHQTLATHDAPCCHGDTSHMIQSHDHVILQYPSCNKV